MSSLTTLGFDADDTLWQHERFFHMTQEHFASLLGDFAEKPHISRHLLEAQKRNLGIYGFGVKGFTLSMIETAITITDEKVPASVLHEILMIGREMLNHPIEPLPHAHEALDTLAGRYRLVLVTKGDLFDQERKLAQSGLGPLFDAVEIVSHKTAATYDSVFARHGNGPGSGMMIGNSLKSDVIPAIEAGSWGVYVPHDLTWEFEYAEEPVGATRYKRIPHLGRLAELVEEIASVPA